MAKYFHKELNDIYHIFSYREDLVDGWISESNLSKNINKDNLMYAFNKIGFRPIWIPMEKCYPYINNPIFGKVFIKKDSKICISSNGYKFVISNEEFNRLYKEV